MPLPGGPANKFGNRYEQWWTVSQLVRIINREAESIRIEDPTVDKAEFVITAGSHREFHQTKRSDPSGKWSLSALSDLLRTMFDQLSANDSTQFVFVSGSDAPDLRELTGRAKSARSPKEFESEFIGPETQKKAIQELQAIWHKTDTATTYSILRRIEVRTIDESGIKEQVRKSLLALFLAKPNNVCDALRSFAEDSIHKDISRKDLISHLQSKGFTLRQLTQPNDAPSLIDEATNRYLEVTRRNLIQDPLIPRSSTQELLAKTRENERGCDCVLTGKAGGGKTGCVIEFVETLRQSSDTAVLAFRLDRIKPVSSTKELGEQLNLEESPALVLATAAEARSSEAVLVIDQLDAVSTTSGRSSDFFEVVEDLLDEVQGLRNRVKFHVVVVCREFDWENDHRLRRPLAKNHANAKDPEKVSVTDFSLDEVKSVLRDSRFKSDLFDAKQLELLCLPQNLSLFLNTNYNPDSQPPFFSTKDLFDHYWDEKRQEVHAASQSDHWMAVIGVLCDKMTTSQQLSVSKETLDQFPLHYLNAMASESVLSFDEKRYAFGHEAFFDYCFARIFMAQDKSLTEFLTKSEQHLFRRAQVRQVLVYLRDADPERYCKELKELLTDKRIRYHLKDIAIAQAVAMPSPKENEWNVLAPWIESELEAIKSGKPNSDKFASLVWGRFFSSQSWFQVVDSKGLIANWLASENGRIVDMGVKYVGIHQRCSGDRVAELLEPFVGVDGDWTQRLALIVQWADLEKSRRFFDLFLKLIDDGTLDDTRGSIAVNSTFWDMMHGVAEAQPAWIPEVVSHWLTRRVSIVQNTSSGTGKPNWHDLFNHDGAGSKYIGAGSKYIGAGSKYIYNSATKAPEEFVQHVLPVVLQIADEAVYGEESTPPRRDAVWRYLFDSEHVSIDNACRDGLAVAVEKLADKKSNSIGAILSDLRSRDTYMANFLLLRAYKAGAEHFADDAVSDLCDKTWRFQCGYSDSPYWIAIQLIKAVTPLCSDENRARLEEAILDYVSDYERKEKGRACFELLSGIPIELRSNTAQARYAELERKFGTLVESPPRDIQSYAVAVGSPIEKTAAEKMTDEQWLKAIKKYDSEEGEYQWENPEKGGALELAEVLQEFVKKEPERFARLSLRFPSDTNPVYTGRTLAGLKETSNFTELKLEVCRKAYSEFRDECGKEISDLLGSIKEPLPDDAVQMLNWLATEHPDPEKELWNENATGGTPYSGGDIRNHGINTIRGRAAEAIGALIQRDSSYIERFRTTVEKLSGDKSTAVRACAASVLLVITNHDWEFALEQFTKLTEPWSNLGEDDRLLATPYVDHFVYCGLYEHFERVQGIVKRMLRSELLKINEAGARLASLAVLLHHNEAKRLVEEALQGNPSQRLGVARVASANIGKSDCREWSEQQLLRLFNDSDSEVRQKSAMCFDNMKEQSLESYENLIDKFCDSAAYEENSSFIHYALKESSHRLPGITYVVCEKFLERFSDEARDIRTSRASGVTIVAKLILRTYHQYQQDEWASKYLDLIDQMCLERIGSISTDLDKYER